MTEGTCRRNLCQERRKVRIKNGTVKKRRELGTKYFRGQQKKLKEKKNDRDRGQNTEGRE